MAGPRATRRRALRWLLPAAAVAALATPRLAAQPPRPQVAPDISGEWTLETWEEDTSGQPPLGDYLGIPFNDAGRMRADTSAESLWGTPEYQCRPHSAPHQWRGLGGARILKEQDPLTREVAVYHIQFMRSLDRPIFMDGRPHPPAYAPHTWSGFSTGQWLGNTLKVMTTHLKDGYLKRGGPQTSDLYSMTEFISRHDDILTITTVVDDPVYMDEPYVHSTTYISDLTGITQNETCSASAFAENGGTDRHWVPHFLPGQNTALGDLLKNEPWVPETAARGGVTTLYPEFRAVMADAGAARALRVPSSKSSVALEKSIADQSPRDGQVHVLPIQGNVFMLVADGVNVTASVGPEGVLLVNTGAAAMSDKVLAALRQVANSTVTPPGPNACFGVNCGGVWGWSSPYINAVTNSPGSPRPLRYIVNTSADAEHVGGNEKLAAAGFFPRTAAFGAAVTALGQKASILAHENVLNRVSAPAGSKAPLPEAAWPTDTYFDDLYKLPAYFNGEAVILYHAPAAVTDGDTFTYFRRSEVIAAGNLFSTISYPVIDRAKGGTIQGVLDGLNKILDLAVAEYRSQGGTWVVPSRGRLGDTADVASYRNMLTMIRDRVRDLKAKGQTLAQVKAARPTMDFDGRYGAATGAWTTDMFVEAVFQTVTAR
jgi:glyoxylase-like metal-dependent hydrolase (beta-lactamase superfamily II)